MSEYSHPLGDAVKRARGKMGLTQNEVADAVDIDVRTVLNIDNGSPVSVDTSFKNRCQGNLQPRNA